MSSNIEITRVCIVCGNDFMARTTRTKYCSKKCNTKDYKSKLRQKKINDSFMQTVATKSITIEKIKTKEFLTVKDVSILLNCSVRTVYYYIESGMIDAVNLGQRMTRIKRSEIDNLFKK